MSGIKHSPEPWTVHEWYGDEGGSGTGIHTEDCDTVCGEFGVGEEDARRIVACVNALKGIPTEALEAGALAKALDLLLSAQSYAAGVAIASERDGSEWSLHRGMGGVLRDRIYDALRSLGLLK